MESMSKGIKSVLAAAIIVIVILLVIFGRIELFIGNRQILDTAMHFDHARVKLADGEVIEGKVDSWRDYENSDQIQVTINGTTYLVHSTNATLIKN
jgi:hypothetical protein